MGTITIRLNINSAERVNQVADAIKAMLALTAITAEIEVKTPSR